MDVMLIPSDRYWALLDAYDVSPYKNKRCAVIEVSTYSTFRIAPKTMEWHTTVTLKVLVLKICIKPPAKKVFSSMVNIDQWSFTVECRLPTFSCMVYIRLLYLPIWIQTAVSRETRTEFLLMVVSFPNVKLIVCSPKEPQEIQLPYILSLNTSRKSRWFWIWRCCII